MGAFSDDANAAMGTTVVRDIARVLRGEQPHNPVTAR
jgi:D-3-phosphoglycerate dehydrogenase